MLLLYFVKNVYCHHILLLSPVKKEVSDPKKSVQHPKFFEKKKYLFDFFSMSSMSLNVTLAFLIINEFSLFLMGAFMWSFASKNESLGPYIQKVRLFEISKDIV